MKNRALVVVLILSGIITNRAMGQWSGSSSNTGNTPIVETPQLGKKKMRARFGLGLTLLNAQSGKINANILSDFKEALPFELTSDISSFEAGFVIGNYIRTKVGSYFSFNMGSSTLNMNSNDLNYYFKANMQVITQEYSYVYGFRQVLSPNPNITANESLPDGYLALQYNVGATLGSVIGNYTQDLQIGQTSEIVSSAYATINIGASLVAGRHFDLGLNLAIPIKKPSATILGSGMPFDIISKDKFGTNLNIKAICFL
jgi:hypothetical protein